jgi:multidrug efflux pump subunit AcrA (membrane-fusion protein)
MIKFINSFIILFFLLSCSENNEYYIVNKEDISESVYASGIIESENQYQIYPTINGILKDVFVEEGDLININSPLLRIENKNTSTNEKNARIIANYNDIDKNKTKINEFKLAVKLAKDKFKLDSLNFNRQKQLFQKSLISNSEFELNQFNYTNSKTNYESAILKLEELTKQLDLNDLQSKNNLGLSQDLSNELVLKSEIKGKVYSILKNKGELVSTQSPVMVIGSNDKFKIILQIDEFDIVKITKGLKVILNLDSYKNQVFSAIITKINPIMNERSKTFTVEARFVTQPKKLYPNLTLEGNIVIKERTNVMTIPRNYLIEDTYVLDKKNEKIKVKTGLKDYQNVEILDGLKENQKIYLPQE